MAERLERAVDVVGAGAGLHADQARREVGHSLGELGPGELEAQRDGTALILTDKKMCLPRWTPMVAVVSTVVCCVMTWLRGCGTISCSAPPHGIVLATKSS